MLQFLTLICLVLISISNGEEPTSEPTTTTTEEIAFECSAFQAPDNAQVINQCGTSILSICEFACDYGYSLQGESTSECLNSGVWSNHGVCKDIDGCVSNPCHPLKSKCIDRPASEDAPDLLPYTCECLNGLYAGDNAPTDGSGCDTPKFTTIDGSIRGQVGEGKDFIWKMGSVTASMQGVLSDIDSNTKLINDKATELAQFVETEIQEESEARDAELGQLEEEIDGKIDEVNDAIKLADQNSKDRDEDLQDAIDTESNRLQGLTNDLRSDLNDLESDLGDTNGNLDSLSRDLDSLSKDFTTLSNGLDRRIADAVQVEKNRALNAESQLMGAIQNTYTKTDANNRFALKTQVYSRTDADNTFAKSTDVASTYAKKSDIPTEKDIQALFEKFMKERSCPNSPVRLGAVSYAVNGNMGGITGADQKCQQDATSRGIPGTWKAFLATSQRNIKDLLPNTDWGRPVLNTQGAQMFPAWSSMFDGSSSYSSGARLWHFGGRYVDENTQSSGSNWYDADGWTGSGSQGQYMGSGTTCNDWTTSSSGSRAYNTEVDGFSLFKTEFQPCSYVMVLTCVNLDC